MSRGGSPSEFSSECPSGVEHLASDPRVTPTINSTSEASPVAPLCQREPDQLDAMGRTLSQ